MATDDGSGGGEKDRDPTEHRLKTAREKGNIPQSKDFLILSALAGFLIVFCVITPFSAGRFEHNMTGIMENFSSIPIDATSLVRTTVQATIEGIYLMAPIVITCFVVTLAAGFAQTQFLFRPESLVPDITRLSPKQGIKRIFGLTNLIEFIKSLIKLCIFTYMLYVAGKYTFLDASRAERWTVPQLVKEICSWFVFATLIILVMQVAITILDILWQRFYWRYKLKMSFQDIKEETKQTEGDPYIKGRQKQIRMQKRRQMMRAAKEATVVITNPTHYAVALKYDSAEDPAPKITAKGMDELALRIRDAAESVRVPVVRDPPLARALYTLPLDIAIPAEFFQPVATIIAYVMRIKTPNPNN